MLGEDIHKFARELWPINRSITGEGVRETLRKISNHLPNLKTISVPSGTKVFDWTVPKEWFVKEAYIITPDGKKICNFAENNLHLVGYSIPFKGNLSLNELKKYLHTRPDLKTAIPYVTSYYNENWGFCLTQDQFNSLKDGTYKIVVDTVLFNGELNYGEVLIKGKSDKEIFLSTYICHPSMANNELSGITVLTFIAKWIQEIEMPEYSYRIIFVPETIGSITYLNYNYKIMRNKIVGGFNLSCLGDDRSFSYLPSRNGNTISDIISKHVLKWLDKNFIEYTWLDRGSDERQYCAPGIDLPVASIMRSKYGKYPEYHTSLDNLENVVTPQGLYGGYSAIKKALEIFEKNKKYNVTTLCEPHLIKKNIKPKITASIKHDGGYKLIMDLISFSDGKNDLLEIAEKLKVPIWDLYETVNQLISHNLIRANIDKN